MGRAMLMHSKDHVKIINHPDIEALQLQGGLLGVLCGSPGCVQLYVDDGAPRGQVIEGDERQIRRIVQKLERARRRKGGAR